MDKIPGLYISFLGILKTGAVAQPLFSAFGDESLEVRLASAGTSVILTTQKHVKKGKENSGQASLPQEDSCHRGQAREAQGG